MRLERYCTMGIKFDVETAVLKPVTMQPLQVRANVQRVINLIIPDLSLGGAERIVVELIRGWRYISRSGSIFRVTLFLLSDANDCYSIRKEHPHVKIVSVSHLRPAIRLRRIARLIHGTGTNLAITHLIGMDGLRTLWESGVQTMPVIHNAEERWNCVPDAFDPQYVPAVFAVCRQVAKSLYAAGCNNHIHVIKHELLPRKVASIDVRNQVRQELGLTEDALLIGMVGKFKKHKRFPFAVEVLANLVQHANIHLAIIGPQRTPIIDQTDEYKQVQSIASSLGVQDRLHLLGATNTVDRFYTAMDVYLNTSSCEGMSIAVMEAQAHGIPCVLSNVGGQSEVASERDILLADIAPAFIYAEAVLKVAQSNTRKLKPRVIPGLTPRLWSWIISHGNQLDTTRNNTVLFVTNNLGQGGAQRSLVNMLVSTGGMLPCALCLLGPSYSTEHQKRLEESHISLFSIGELNTYEKVNSLLEIIAAMEVGTICFWNAEARIKMLISKVLFKRSIKIVDVSPGPKLFSALEGVRSFGERIAFSPEEYISRLDAFVAKYEGGSVPSSINALPRTCSVISNGVYIPNRQQDSVPHLRPLQVSPRYAVVTTGRIVPAKMIERMFAAFHCLIQIEPRATLTIVGKVEGDFHAQYWDYLQSLYQEMELENVIYFLGEDTTAKDYLAEFRAFLMLSSDQGCPNASLEAMACGVPIIANPDGGTAEQVIDGITGFLVDETRPEEIANRLKWIFDNPEAAVLMGENGRKRAANEFSMEKMYTAYQKLLWSST